jgi:hypothetical protein
MLQGALNGLHARKNDARASSVRSCRIPRYWFSYLLIIFFKDELQQHANAALKVLPLNKPERI